MNSCVSTDCTQKGHLLATQQAHCGPSGVALCCLKRKWPQSSEWRQAYCFSRSTHHPHLFSGVNSNRQIIWRCWKSHFRLYTNIVVFCVEHKFMLLHHPAALVSIIRYNMLWYHNGKVICRFKYNLKSPIWYKLLWNVKQYSSLQTLYEQSVVRQTQKIVSNPPHILCSRSRFYHLLEDLGLLRGT